LVNGRAKLPNWEHLWSDLVHEERRWKTRDKTLSKGDDEENYALDGKEKKGKGKKSQSKVELGQGGKKKYLSKIKCFHYHELGHYARKCPHKKSYKKIAGGEVGETLNS